MADQFEDAPGDTSSPLPLSSHPHAFTAPNGSITARPLHAAASDTRGDGIAYIDEVPTTDVRSEAGGEVARGMDEGAVPPFQRLDVGVVHPPDEEDGEGELLSGEEGGEGELELEEEYDEEDGDIENEDWEVADADFTKQYNRMRQHHTALSGSSSTRSVPLPARNAGRGRIASPAASTSSGTGPARSLGPLATAPSSASAPGVPSAPKAAYTKANIKDKADRATQEQVLDPRTKAVLASLVRKGLVENVGGCVSTGKEANVYHGQSPAVPPVSSNTSSPYPTPYPASIALKVYKTSILSFKSRSAYMVGEHRLKNAYTAVSNPRKMVRTWAEKELRNLRRLKAGGVACPSVVEVRENVLVMEFLGDTEGRPSPRLKDADISQSKLADLYAELIIAMRWMYHRCRIVHADLSEYNILYHNKSLYIIDVSQSVEHDHPSSFDFLRKDIQNMNDYFVKRSGGAVRTLGIKGAFDFIANVQLRGAPAGPIEGESEDELREVLRQWLDEGVGLQAESNAPAEIAQPTTTGAAQPATSQRIQSQTLNDNEFMSAYIPRSLAEVYDPERDTAKLKAGDSDLIYAGVTGLDAMPRAQAGVQEVALAETAHTAGEERTVRFAEDEEQGTESGSGSSDEEAAERRPRGFRHEDRDAKKERKKAIKEENREKRKTKMPKADKAKLIKKNSHHK